MSTPIEKNIMDLYGLIWFIDETVLPDDREFLARYLRRPERYPELSELVQPYCFRTLRAQAQSYAKVTRRVLFTYEYTPSSQGRALYDLLYAYVNQPVKLASRRWINMTWPYDCWGCKAPPPPPFCRPSGA